MFEKVHINIVGLLKHEGLYGEKYYLLTTEHALNGFTVY